ncbi:MAG: 16S rRNA (uracil(1498)-N(3))-methyltransferase, partial [Saprospiraceae bacterium]|nr:16S rRNA (uracil(1498)-N(3))-methyltransferase [Saprospiraceae bacterium]
MSQLFFTPKIENGFAIFEEEEGRHLSTVLRKKPGDKLRLTDGKGHFYEAELADAGKRQVLARIISSQAAPVSTRGRLHMAIAPTKNMDRLEWFLEKATEIGVDEITPILCKHSERETLRLDRLEKILVSAMKQSLRAWLPQLNPFTKFTDFVKKTGETQKRLAWCGDEPMPHLKNTLQPDQNTVVAIGPEGDFSPEEVTLALSSGFQAVSLGEARLRTETAGIYAVTVFGLLDIGL